MNNSKILATIGYEGLKPEDFLGKLKENNVSVLVDVRQNPISRKQGFSKSRLEIFLQGMLPMGFFHIEVNFILS